MDGKKIKVVVFPWREWTSSNPYLDLLYSPMKDSGVEIIYSDYHRFFPLLANYAKYKPQLFHIHWHYSVLRASNPIKTFAKFLAFLFEIFSLKILGVKIVWTIHELNDLDNKRSMIDRISSKALFLFADKVIVHGESAKDILEENNFKDFSKLAVIPHGNYISCYENNLSKEEARKALELDEKDFVFLYFGRVRPYKGIENLLEKFKKIASKNARLIIAGPAADVEIRESVEKAAEGDERIKLILRFIFDDSQLYLNSADVIVLPYKKILTSGTVFLAMSFKKPIIVPKMGCVKDILDEKGGFFYDPDDENGLADALEAAMKSGDLLKMGDHNFELAKKLDWKDIAARTAEVYRQALEK